MTERTIPLADGGVPRPANEDAPDSPPRSPQGDDVFRLLASAGPGPVPRPEARAAAKRVARAAWEAKVASHGAARRRRFQRMTSGWTMAAAAAVAAALGAYFLLGPPAPSTVSAPPEAVARVATVEALWSSVQVRDARDGGVAFLAASDPLAEQSEVNTGATGRAALRLATGHALRLDVGTRVRLGPDAAVYLEEGAVYVDSAGARPGTSVAVHLPLAVVREVGTQFEVRLVDGALRVRVREGRVDVDVGGDHHSAPAGQEVTVGGDGTIETHAAPSWGEGWSWVLQSSPAFDLEGRTVAEMLDWMARETGWHVSYADASLAQEVGKIVIHSSVEGLRPDEAPELVLPSSGLGYELRGGELVVRRP